MTREAGERWPEAARLVLRLKDIVAAEAKERQREHGGTAPGKKSLRQNSVEVNRTDETLAKVLNLGSHSSKKTPLTI